MGILIKNGHILNPPTGTDEVMDLYVEGDRVTKMQKDPAAGADDRVIDASGCYVFRDLSICMCICATRDLPQRRH